MAKRLTSDILLDGSELKNLTACSRSGIFGALGLDRMDLQRKPLIGIVNSYTNINPGSVRRYCQNKHR